MRSPAAAVVSLLVPLLALAATARGDLPGPYAVAGTDFTTGSYRGRGSIEALGGGGYRVRVQRDGAATGVAALASMSGGALTFVVSEGTPGLAGAVAPAGGTRRVAVTLAPATGGGLRATWRDAVTFSVLRREVWTPAAPTPTPPAVLSGLDPTRPDEAAVLRLLAEAGRDATIDVPEASALAEFAKAAGGRSARIAPVLRALSASDRRLTPAAAALLARAAAGERPDDVPLDNAVYRVVVGSSPFLEDDALYLVGAGVVSGDTGLRSHSRGYAAKRDGVLFTRHGSLAPPHPTTSTPAETSALRAQGPDAALDRVATLAGLRLSQFTTFSATARSPAYYDPSSRTPDWAGICQGWTHNALDDRLSLLVDAPGVEGARGLWIFGEWISRADLGNAMMGASYSLGIADSVTIDSFVKPDKLVKALAQHVLRSGVGLRVDIWNDAHNASGAYNPQIWNQPVVAGSVEVGPVPAAARAAILARAAAEPPRPTPVPADADVRFVRARARWGAETNDAWEGEPRLRSSEWNMYMITASDGRVVRSYMAHELAAAGVAGLPVTRSDGLPDYMAVPRHELTDAALSGAPHRLLDPSNPEGARFRLLVGTVLARGIPEPTRAAFEAEALAPGADPAALAARYPGVANAYSPAQWARALRPALGPGKAFGAVWSE
jgi:hypothetical protein